MAICPSGRVTVLIRQITVLAADRPLEGVGRAGLSKQRLEVVALLHRHGLPTYGQGLIDERAAEKASPLSVNFHNSTP